MCVCVHCQGEQKHCLYWFTPLVYFKCGGKDHVAPVMSYGVCRSAQTLLAHNSHVCVTPCIHKLNVTRGFSRWQLDWWLSEHWPELSQIARIVDCFHPQLDSASCTDFASYCIDQVTLMFLDACTFQLFSLSFASAHLFVHYFTYGCHFLY